MRMVISKEGWPWRPDLCPADQDFIDYVQENNGTGLRIFHMGTGMHHVVGINTSIRNYVLGITCCPEEMQAYMNLIIEDPILQWSYQCLFTDIHVLNWNQFKDFDVITLFHLGEIESKEIKQYAVYDSYSVLRQAWDSLNNGGKLILYKGSLAASRIMPMALNILGEPKEEFRSLAIWK